MASALTCPRCGISSSPADAVSYSGSLRPQQQRRSPCSGAAAVARQRAKSYLTALSALCLALCLGSLAAAAAAASSACHSGGNCAKPVSGRALLARGLTQDVSDGGVDMYSPAPRINAMPCQFWRVEFGGPTSHARPVDLFTISGAKE